VPSEPTWLHPEAITEARAAREWYRLRNEDAGNAFMAELDAAIEHIDSLSSWCIGKRPPGSRSWRSRTHDGALGIGLDASNLTRRLAAGHGEKAS